MKHIKLFSALYTRRCCCISNRNGAIISTALGTVISCVIVMFCIVGLVLGFVYNDKDENGNTDIGIWRNEYGSFEARITLITTLVFALINIVLNIMLFCGILLHKHILMVPWIAMFLLFIIISLPVGIFATIGSFHSELASIRMTNEALSRTLTSEKRHTNFYPVLIWIILTPIESYIWLVVFSVYRDIRDRNFEIYGFRRKSSKTDRKLIMKQQINDLKQKSSIYPVDI